MTATINSEIGIAAHTPITPNSVAFPTTGRATEFLYIFYKGDFLL